MLCLSPASNLAYAVPLYHSYLAYAVPLTILTLCFLPSYLLLLTCCSQLLGRVRYNDGLDSYRLTVDELR